MKEEDIVLCTVTKIEGTTVFVNIEGNGQGTIIFPEIAAGRIRNIREYVVPNKKIVCKILQIFEGHPQLSLRRVTSKEKQEVLEKHEKEKTLFSILKTISKDPEKILESIKSQFQADEFMEKVRENIAVAEKFITKPIAEALAKILLEKKEKEREVKRLIILSSQNPSGIEDIKSILNVKDKTIEIKYLGSSQFMLIKKAPDAKQAEQAIQQAITEIQEKAKSKKASLEVKEK